MKHIGVAGRYTILATSPNGEQRVLADWFDNLITDAGLNALANTTVGLLFNFCRLGSGTAAPANSDTALGAQLGYAAAQSVVVGANTIAPVYKYARYTYRFSPGTVVGNISELGVSLSIDSALFSRALIKDGSGAPTTIAVLADETLDVLYEVRFYQPTTDWVGTVVLDGNVYNVTMRAAFNTNAPSLNTTIFPNSLISYSAFETLGATSVGAQPTGGGTSQTGVPTFLPYVTGSFARDFEFSATLDQLNMGTNPGGTGIKAAELIGSIAYWQVKFVPPIPKDATKVLTLRFRLSWGRL